MKIKGLETLGRYSTLKDEDKLEAFVRDFLAGGVLRFGWDSSGGTEQIVLGNALGTVVKITAGTDLINDKPELLLEVI